jgi:hypothetical protein
VKLPRIAFAFFLAVSLVPASFAKGPKEIYLDSAGLELLGGANRISLAPGFNWGFFDWLQVGGQLAYQSLSFGDESVNTTTIRLGPTFNMGGPYATATFIFLGYAIRKGSGTVADPLDDPAGSGLALIVGRRIPLFGTITYRPSIGLQMAGKSSFIINALAVSYFF